MTEVDIIETYLSGLPSPCTWERVRDGFWYVRIAGTARSWIPIELELGERTLRIESKFCIPPEENQADAYRYLLQHAHRTPGVGFSSDRERIVCVLTAIPREVLDADSLDEAIGRVVDLTETTFQGYLRLGFASRFRL
jgi:hypothetical protein